jgi:hypothetical protein
MIDMRTNTDNIARESGVRTKIISSRDLTSECWHIQFRGLPYCKDCEYLATEMCGGQRIRKKILRGEYPVYGLPGISLRE